MRLLMLLTVFAAGCASGPSLESAISIHNTARKVIVAADDAYAPVYAAAYEAADQAYPEDDVAHARQMEHYDAVLVALQQAKLLEQSMHLAIDQWQQGFDDGSMTREAAACGVEALRMLASKAGAIPKIGPFVAASAEALSIHLEQIASSAGCTVHP